jgi:putative ABC transport system permease protein
MLGLAARNLSARKRRALTTALAVFFGVAMIAGTLMLSGSVNRSFDELFDEAYAGIDVSVQPRTEVSGDFGYTPTPGFDAAVLADVRDVEGVAVAAGGIGDPTITVLDPEGDRVGPAGGGPPHIAVNAFPEPLEPFVYVAGSPPSTGEEVGIDSITAEAEGFEIGDPIRITGPAGAREYRLSGIAEFAGGTPLGGATLAGFTLTEAQRLTDKQGKFDEIAIAAGEGVSAEELAERVGAVLPDDLDARTGAQAAADESEDIKDAFSFLTIALLVFAGIAVFVGAFLIFNTFSITVAQRVREFAMLRTLGASSRQVLAAVLLEATLIGLLASAAGIVGGVGFVEALRALFSGFGSELPTSGLVINATTIGIPLAVGTAATVVSALVPALRATGVAPLEALRSSAGAQDEAERTTQRRRTVIAIVMVALGTGLMLRGLFASDDLGAALLQLGLGLVLVFIGVALLGGRFVPPLASAIGWPIERLRGVTGRLARENSQRQPGRTATTAAALMIGVALVVFVGVFSSSLRASVDDTLERQFVGDVAIFHQDGFSPIPPRMADELGELEGIGPVAPFAGTPARIEEIGEEATLNGIEPEGVAAIANLDWVEGSDELLADLGPAGALVEDQWAEDNGVAVGDRLTITGPDGRQVTVTVEGSVRDQAGLIVPNLAAPRQTLRRELGASDDFFTFAGFAPGADLAASRQEVDAFLTDRFPSAEARSQEELREEWAGEIDQLIAMIYVLLGLSVLVSIFGVVNTVSVTILERTREFGMLRAIGTSRSQVRRMVRYETVVTVLLGAIVGAVIGLGLGAAAVEALEGEGLILSISPALPIVVLLGAAALGVIAAIGPARRASRVNVIEALQYE